MNEIFNGILQAINLILTLNPEVVEITTRTLFISLSATFIGAIISIPIGGLINFKKFRGKRSLINLIQTLYSLPTVLVGLFVFLLLSQSGIFGDLRLLFTPTGMIIGQIILIMPILIGFTITALKSVGNDIIDLSISLGASEFQAICTIMREARYAIMAAVILGFGRAISEVGVAIMIGGNIRGFTRVITTTISLET
ncbi:MAG: ABC transporter permease, partial [Methanobacteriaceae archaeon]|nr:ABC transporter permease [Methanobacteriaceae archaeon]